MFLKKKKADMAGQSLGVVGREPTESRERCRICSNISRQKQYDNGTVELVGGNRRCKLHSHCYMF